MGLQRVSVTVQEGSGIIYTKMLLMFNENKTYIFLQIVVVDSTELFILQVN